MSRYRRGVPPKKRSQVFMRDGYRCVFSFSDGTRCRVQGGPFDYSQLTLEHKIPLCAGGSNEMDNLETMCEAHNREMDQRYRASIGLPAHPRPHVPILFKDVVRGGHVIEELHKEFERVRARKEQRRREAFGTLDRNTQRLLKPGSDL